MRNALRGEADCARLMARAKAGDREAFGRLYARHFDAIRRYLCTALRDAHEAEDAAQDVFVQAFRALPQYESRGPGLRPWLFRIARNIAIDRARRRRSSPHDPAALEAHLDSDPRDALDELLANAALKSHIARLPDAQREIVFLRYAGGFDGNELAQMTSRTPAAVRQLHHRALAELRRRVPASAAV